MEIYGERISDDKLPYEPTGQTMDSILKYPSKIYVDKDRLIISDAGHNRLLQCDKQGRIMVSKNSPYSKPEAAAS